ncbi:MAG TPA: TerC family protein [Stellaceae bacterium]|jgi:YjbE family integral membrane protein
MLTDPQFWFALFQIAWINILLSGDNAVVIALACRSLPPRQQKLGIVLGTGPAVILRIVFAVFIVHLMLVPFLKIAGGLLLLWIAVQMLLPDDEADHAGLDAAGAIAGKGKKVRSSTSLLTAVRTIVVADAVMSLDNVIAIAGAARGDVVLLSIGLLISMPLIIFGSTLLLRLLARFPLLVTAGGALLGYIGGETIVSDPVLNGVIEHNAPDAEWLGPMAGAIVAVVLGLGLARRRRSKLRKRVDLIS